jgi:sodium/potassium-transporting ATPase subunit beta
MSDSEIKERSGFLNFVYNPVTGAWFTRTPLSWLKIGLFYLIYYSGLTAFFAGMLAVFIKAFTDDVAPVLTGGYSVLPPNPGMGFRPMPDIEKTLIRYNMQDEDTIRPYKNNMDYFLNLNDSGKLPPNKPAKYSYKSPDQDTEEIFSDCTDQELAQAKHNGTKASNSDKPCKFKVLEMAALNSSCFHSDDYGFEVGKPCVIVKLNKVFEFIPQLNTTKSPENFLKIECKGEHPADVDNIGPVDYFPKQGFDVKYFPYLNQKHYLNPLVFVKFRQPAIGVLIQVVCMPVNVDNILQNKYMRGDGRVHFELLIDNFKPKKKD